MHSKMALCSASMLSYCKTQKTLINAVIRLRVSAVAAITAAAAAAAAAIAAAAIAAAAATAAAAIFTKYVVHK